jgi:hypothetical protein
MHEQMLLTICILTATEKGTDIKQDYHKTKQFSENYSILSVKIHDAVNIFYNLAN